MAMMKNRILAVTIFLLPVGLFSYFWLQPVTDKAPAGAPPAVATPAPPTNAPTTATNTPP